MADAMDNTAFTNFIVADKNGASNKSTIETRLQPSSKGKPVKAGIETAARFMKESEDCIEKYNSYGSMKKVFESVMNDDATLKKLAAIKVTVFERDGQFYLSYDTLVQMVSIIPYKGSGSGKAELAKVEEEKFAMQSQLSSMITQMQTATIEYNNMRSQHENMRIENEKLNNMMRTMTQTQSQALVAKEAAQIQVDAILM